MQNIRQIAVPSQRAGDVSQAAFLIFLAAHIVTWSLFPTLLYWSESLPHDMTEAWAWGKEFRLGYFKHPPFYSWIAALWFHLLPRTDFCFYLLAALSAGVGLFGVWMLAGQFLEGRARLAAVLLMGLAPFFGVMAINYNANTSLLMTWPWTAYFFVRSIESGKFVHGAAFGAMAAAAVLSKYYSVILLCACLIASLLHPERRRIWRAPAPYAGILVAGLLIAPHLWWAATTADMNSLTYAANRFGFAVDVLLWKVTVTAMQSLAYFALPLLAFFAAFGREGSEYLRHAFAELFRRDQLWITALAWGPYLLTLAAGTIGTVKLSWNYLIPAFFMVPTVTLALGKAKITAPHMRTLVSGCAAYLLIALLLAPIASYAFIVHKIDLGYWHRETSEPRRELAVEANRLWHEVFGSRHLGLFAASTAYGHGASFYAPDAPSDFTWLNISLAPWVTADRIAREGLLIACLSDDPLCLEPARVFIAPGTRQFTLPVTRTFMGMREETKTFVLFLVPPRERL